MNQKGIEEAKLMVLIWAIDSMADHRMKQVIFASKYLELVGAAVRPKAWPSFSSQSDEIHKALERINGWKLVLTNKEANRGASLIASSITRDLRLHSYVAVGFPSWLHGMFGNDRG